MENGSYRPKILVVTMARSSYLAVDALGQMHADYPTSVYVIKTIYPGILPAYFYVDTLKKGMDGIIIASAGSDCPVEDSYKHLADVVKQAQSEIKAAGLSVKRLKLTAICSVCTAAILKEINQMAEFTIKLKAEGKV